LAGGLSETINATVANLGSKKAGVRQILGKHDFKENFNWEGLCFIMRKITVERRKNEDK
jgi:hypothetical protein